MFVILVDGRVVQVSAPLYGGDTTTIVGDLSRFEDQTVTIELRANGGMLGSRTIHVNCSTAVAEPDTGAGTGPGGAGTTQPAVATSGSLPAVGSAISAWVLALGLGLSVARIAAAPDGQGAAQGGDDRHA